MNPLQQCADEFIASYYPKARQDRFNLRTKSPSGTHWECGSRRELEITGNAFPITWITVSMVLETNLRENKWYQLLGFTSFWV